MSLPGLSLSSEDMIRRVFSRQTSYLMKPHAESWQATSGNRPRMPTYIRLRIPLLIHIKRKEKDFWLPKLQLHVGEIQCTTHSNHPRVSHTTGNINREFEKLIPEDEHSLHSLNSFKFLGYPSTSQYIRKPRQFWVSQLLLNLQGCAFVWGILTALTQGKGA